MKALEELFVCVATCVGIKVTQFYRNGLFFQCKHQSLGNTLVADNSNTIGNLTQPSVPNIRWIRREGGVCEVEKKRGESVKE
jgi:hypothetical protein